MQKIVADTNVVVSAIMSKTGNPAKIMDLFFTRQVDVYYSDAIMLEYEDVLFRPHFKFDTADVYSFFTAMKEFGIFMEPEISTAEMPDEDDRAFYDAAKTINAYLITGNLKHYPDEPHIIPPARFVEMFEVL